MIVVGFHSDVMRWVWASGLTIYVGQGQGQVVGLCGDHIWSALAERGRCVVSSASDYWAFEMLRAPRCLALVFVRLRERLLVCTAML